MRWVLCFLISFSVQAGCNCMCDDGATFYTSRRSYSVLNGRGDGFGDYIVSGPTEEEPPKQAEVITIRPLRRPDYLVVTLCGYNIRRELVCRDL